MTILGTRPEIIRLCLIIKKIDGVFDHVLVHTGQNYAGCLNATGHYGLTLNSIIHLKSRLNQYAPVTCYRKQESLFLINQFYSKELMIPGM